MVNDHNVFFGLVFYRLQFRLETLGVNMGGKLAYQHQKNGNYSTLSEKDPSGIERPPYLMSMS